MKEISKDDVVQALGNLSVMELIALTKKLENQWGVKAEPQITFKVNEAQPENKESAQTEFNVILSCFPADKKMSVLKMVRELTGLGLKEAKEFIEAAPKMVKEAVSSAEADMYKAKLEESGATVEIK